MRLLQNLGPATTALLAMACAAQQPGSSNTALEEGTYRVVARECHGGEAEETACERTRYIEIVRGKFHGVRNNELGIVEWMAVDPQSGPYTYNARRLRGHIQENQYIIDELSLSTYESRESFLLEAGRPSAYRFQKQMKEAVPGEAVSFYYKLSPVPRDAALAAQIPYPPPLPDE